MLKIGNYTTLPLFKKLLLLTRGISHSWVCTDSTSRISSQPQFRSDTRLSSDRHDLIPPPLAAILIETVRQYE